MKRLATILAAAVLAGVVAGCNSPTVPARAGGQPRKDGGIGWTGGGGRAIGDSTTTTLAGPKK
jgi:hypothetical protein